MSIPLVQEATKDAINTSIIAIKRNIERINMLLGLVDSGSPDLSGLATKQELEDAITQVETDLAPVDEVTSGNMHSVTSNAVSKAMSYSTEEIDTGLKWIDGKKIYHRVISEDIASYTDSGIRRVFVKTITYIDSLINVSGNWVWITGDVAQSMLGRQISLVSTLASDVNMMVLWSCNITKTQNNYDFVFITHKGIYPITKIKINLSLFYTKTTD